MGAVPHHAAETVIGGQFDWGSTPDEWLLRRFSKWTQERNLPWSRREKLAWSWFSVLIFHVNLNDYQFSFGFEAWGKKLLWKTKAMLLISPILSSVVMWLFHSIVLASSSKYQGHEDIYSVPWVFKYALLNILYYIFTPGEFIHSKVKIISIK